MYLKNMLRYQRLALFVGTLLKRYKPRAQQIAPVNRNSISFVCLLLLTSNLYATENYYNANELPPQARVWQDRNGEEHSGYSDFSGSSIAFYDNAWFYQDENTNWRVFHRGPVLNFEESDNSITETLQYEVLSGSAFANQGNAGMYNLSLIGETGELVTENGARFNPQNYIRLQDSDGNPQTQFFYDTVAKTWWDAHPDHWGEIVSAPVAPYKPTNIPSGGIPSPSLFGSDVVNQYSFDIATLRYFNNTDSQSIAGFHQTVITGYRRWDSANYQENLGKNIAFHNNIWYRIEDETHYYPFYEGRYLDFNLADRDTISGLEVFLFDSLSLASMPSDTNSKLDGVTGKLITENPATIILFEPILSLQGIAKPDKQSNTVFKATTTEVTLLRVVPLRNRVNDPFNDRTLPILINTVRQPLTPTVNVPTSPPPSSGACPLNTALAFVGTLPDGMPLGQSINLGTTIPFQVGIGLFNAAINIAIVNPANVTEGVVSLDTGYSYISGSALGTVTEGTNLAYLIRRNSDGAEFEISFSFTVELVFDDMGIVIQTLSARLCQGGGPV